MYPSAQFWKKFYLVITPLTALIILRDAFVDFFYLHRAGSFSITFEYSLMVWILWLMLSPAIAWGFRRIVSRPEWQRILLLIALAIGASAFHQTIHHWMIGSNLTFLRLFWGVLMVSIFLSYLYANKLQEDGKEAEIHATRIEKEIEAARLLHVRTQLDPGLLLHSLQEARIKIPVEPEKAEELLANLADKLRIALRSIPTAPGADVLTEGLRSNRDVKVHGSRTTWLILLSLVSLLVGILMAGARLLDDLYVWHAPTLEWETYWNLWLSWLGVSLLTPFIFWMSRFQSGKRLSLHLGACILFWCLINGSLQLKNQGLQHWQSILPTMMSSGLGYGFKFDVYGSVLIAAIAFNHLELKRKKDLRVAENEVLLVGAQLDALKMQIHPHFLFNSLNSIMELIHQNQERAVELLFCLEEFLRMTLVTQEVQDVPLRKELDFVECYLDMQKIRFPKRLIVKMEIDEDCMESRVPVLLLQPLVENAVRHGIAHAAGAGEISIQSKKGNGTLQLKIRDTGPGIASHKIQEGIGLANTKRRLEHMYGNDFRFEMQNEEMGGLLVSIEIPSR
jgi:two-component system, LytTR family, sensor kinase